MARTADIHGRSLSLMDQWRRDWNKCLADFFKARLDREQREIIDAIQHNQRVSVSSGTARGKDFVAACAAACFLILTPRWRMNRSTGMAEMAENTKIALTAPTERQVKDIMMPEITRLFRNALAQGGNIPGFHFLDTAIRTDFKEWFLVGFKADKNNHEAWTGFHAVHTMFVITEATGIEDNIFDAIEGNLQGDSRILLIFNPNSPTGYAAKSQKGDRWTKFQLNSLTAPNVVEKRIIIPGQVDYQWVKDKIDRWCTPIAAGEVNPQTDDFRFEGQWFRPEDLFRTKVLGKFPKVSEDVLIPQQWLDMAHRRWSEAGGTDSPKNREPRMLGVDVAGMGRDNSCLVERHGPFVSPIYTYNSGGQADHMKIAGMIRARRRTKPDMAVSIDTIGEGAGVYSRCLETDDPAFIISCKYSEAAKRNDRPLTDSTGERTFLNMRAYLFWAVRDWLDPKNGGGAMLPPDARFDEEATEIRWSFRSDGRIYIEPKDDIKKRLGRSPDRFDALANTFYPTRRRNAVNLERLANMIGR